MAVTVIRFTWSIHDKFGSIFNWFTSLLHCWYWWFLPVYILWSSSFGISSHRFFHKRSTISVLQMVPLVRREVLILGAFFLRSPAYTGAIGICPFVVVHAACQHRFAAGRTYTYSLCLISIVSSSMSPFALSFYIQALDSQSFITFVWSLLS